MNNPPDVSPDATLLVFTVVTVALSYVDFGAPKANVAVAMLVATFKAGLVAAIFMHLAAEKRLIYRILIFTGLFVLALFWLTFLAWYDYPVVR
jgi:cytochrome c oxidase subunit 4